MNKTELQALTAVLKARFEAHEARHPALDWAQVQQRLEKNTAAQKALDKGVKKPDEAKSILSR